MNEGLFHLCRQIINICIRFDSSVRAQFSSSPSTRCDRFLNLHSELHPIGFVLLLPLLGFRHGRPLLLPPLLELGLLDRLPLLALALPSDAPEGPMQGPFAPLHKVRLESRLKEGADQVRPRDVVHVGLPHLFRPLPKLPGAARSLPAVSQLLGGGITLRIFGQFRLQPFGHIQDGRYRNGVVEMGRILLGEAEGADTSVLTLVDVHLRARQGRGSARAEAVLEHVFGILLAFPGGGPFSALLVAVLPRGGSGHVHFDRCDFAWISFRRGLLRCRRSRIGGEDRRC
mmetsp:Transcript_11394/g.33563  ORF Transcript_11394/g.33563 Transcript_11394/m.33563 type:complete len:286 (+) Transcript_11394:1308-2165(+)